MAKSLVLNRSRKVPAEDTAAFGAIAERFRRAGALERAVELCREGLQKFPGHISARVTLGWSLLDLGKYDEARTELEQVLRRAPDNLAAIRGLAELHDRFEHTLHLPMDGPDTWPPPPESIAETAGEPAAAGEDAASPDLEMTPAALGVPIWSPGVGPTPAAETPMPQAAASAPAAMPSDTAMAWEASVPAPAVPGSGMSSVREIEFAPAAQPHEALAKATEVAADAYEVNDADIRALIAEADTLDAAAVATPAESETVSLQAIAAEAEDPLAAADEAVPRALAYSSVTETISVDLDLDAAPVSIAAAGEVLTMDEIVRAETVADAALEPAIAACAHVELAVAAARPPAAPVAAAEVVSIDVARTAARSAVPALERFLTKVQARRAQLMTESVA